MTALERTEQAPAVTGPPAAADTAAADTAAPGTAAAGTATNGGAAAGEGGHQPKRAEDRQPTVAVGRRQVVRAVGLGVTLLGVFLLGFAAYLYGLSSVQESRSQATLYKQLSNELGNALAPVGPTTPGAPVAILNIPSIGVHDLVVVEGTTSENLRLGPGHLRDTPLPGQGGTSMIYGRRTTFGAPFSRLAQLRPGDKITAITGQGTSSYTVVALGSSHRLVENPATNQLILLTAASSTIPTYYLYVDANLTSTAQQSPGGLPDIGPQETALSGDDNALVLTTLWAFALALVSVGATVAAARWSPWLTYLCAAPIVLAVLWNLYENLAALLPNVY
jgi:sortase A